MRKKKKEKERKKRLCRISVGEYPKNSDNYPNTGIVLNTFKYTIRAQRV
jgi:hypothetical protein